MKILVAEDDPRHRGPDRALSPQARMDDTHRRRRRRRTRLRARQPVDVVILDVMLPGLSGLEVCRVLRGDKATEAIPIIMVTARAEESERIAGLETGADDYLPKPFSPNELVARVRAVMRRSKQSAAESPTLTCGPIVMDLSRHTVSDGGRDVKLTAKEFCSFNTCSNIGVGCSRAISARRRVGLSLYGGTRTVDVHVRRLAGKASGAGRGPGHRETVRLQACGE
jgi:two-component system alkaline phosphatase synthesis response regulator PhoP